LIDAVERGFPSHIRGEVIDAMTTNETSWFRDGTPFDTFSKVVLPEWDKQQSKPMRIWSSACSSGQEPYTLSILLSEHTRQTPSSRVGNSQIVATDISPSMLKMAQQGEYEEAMLLRGLSMQRRQSYFSQIGDVWKVDRAIQQRVGFKSQNLLQNFSMLGKFDIIFCRNVLIYFSKENKQDILERMSRQLNPGGYLFLGASETITGYTDAFELVRTSYSPIYRVKA
jgi:chemotaxis protein methyltransferase CheR